MPIIESKQIFMEEEKGSESKRKEEEDAVGLLGEEVPSIISYGNNIFTSSVSGDKLVPFTPPFAKLQNDPNFQHTLNIKPFKTADPSVAKSSNIVVNPLSKIKP